MLGPDAVEPAAQLGFGPLLLGGQVEEVALFLVELDKLGSVAFAQLVSQLTVSAHCLVNARPSRRQPFGRHGDRGGVVSFHGGLSDFYGDTRQVAHTVLATPAIEVVVIATPTALGVGDHQPVFATLAKQKALEEVVMSPMTDVGIGVLSEQPLHLLEQFRLHQSRMSPPILHAVMFDIPDVVAISQYEPELLGADRSAWRVNSGGHPQPGLRQLDGQRPEVLLTGRVQLEGHPHQRRPFRVEHHAVDRATVDRDALVQVAHRSAVHRSAIPGAVRHLGLDVFTAQADLQPVEDIGHGLHAFGHDAVAEVLAGGDQFDAELL
ncbi:hypothetical protein OG439_46370 [Amycolatopsis sp. NBC_01307]|nr:hypothetical protein OG439_46370 [Amycolatopsis sp. NBC_01307]